MNLLFYSCISLTLITSFIIGIAGIIATVIFGNKKQQIKNDSMFKELFESFNKRYDNDFNDLLNELKLNSEKELSTNEKQIIIGYFNLCSEEYLWYKKGRIPSDVWSAWKSGIKENLKISKVKDVFENEIRTPDGRNSFYGLVEELEKLG